MEELMIWLAGGSIILTVLLILVSLVCTLVPIAAIFGGIFWYIRKRGNQANTLNQAAQMWPSTTGQIVKSRVEVSGGEHTSVSPRIEYQYEVNGVLYQSDRLKAGDHFLRNAGNAYTVVDRYPVGMTVTVYYDPANPAQSALER